jgi:hypothetical protein
MKLKKRAETTSRAVFDAIQATPEGEQAETVTHIIHEALIQAALETHVRCADVAMNCASADQDIAHKIAKEIRQGEQVLIANLSSLR